MSLEDAFLWLGDTGPGRFLAESTIAFATTEALHILSIGVIGGAFFALDLTALGVVFRKSDVLRIGRLLFPVLITGLAAAAVTGVLLVAAGPMKYYTNELFPLKLVTLLGAILIHLAIYPGLTVLRTPAAAYVRLASAILAALSLALWLGVAILGRWLGLI